MIKNFLIYAINIAIGAVITIFVTYKFDNSEIEYKDSKKEQYLNMSNEAFKDLNLSYLNKKIENISMYQVAFFNKTYKEFENVNLYFTLKSRDGVNTPNLINKEFFAPSNLPSNIGISEIKKIKDDLYMVNIKVMKKTPDDKYYLARFIFEGDKLPDINFSTPENINLEIVEYSNTKEWIIIITFITIVLLIFIIIMSIVGSFDLIRSWKKRKERFVKVLNKTQNFDDKTVENIIDIYEKEFRPKDGYFYKKTRSFIDSFKSNK